MTKFIAVSNRRGGVGKTTTTMMLAYGLSVLGYQRVLVIDIDPQASTSLTLMGHERWSLARQGHNTIGDVLVEMYGEGDVDIRKSVARQVGDVHLMPGRRRPDLDLLPASFELDAREREILLSGAGTAPTIELVFKKLETRVAEILRSFDGHYDVVLMDCPPGLSNIAWGALTAADFVLVPYIPDATAQDNIGWFHTELMRRDPGKQVRVLPNRVRTNNTFQSGIMDSVHDNYKSLGVMLPMRAAIEGALDFRSTSEPLRSKFGDGAMLVDGLFKAMLKWFESAPIIETVAAARADTGVGAGAAINSHNDNSEDDLAGADDDAGADGYNDETMISLEELDFEEAATHGRTRSGAFED